jgi:hypothetical protein
MRRIDLMQERHIISVEELEFDAKLTVYKDRQEAKWQAEDARRGHPPSEVERDNRLMWQQMVEEWEWDRFYGVADEAGPDIGLSFD